MKKIALFALAALAAACSELGISDPPDPIPAELSFTSRIDPAGPLLERGVSAVSVEEGAVEVDGLVPGPGCQELSAVAEANTDGQVVLRVRMTQTLALCASIAAVNYRYTARIEGLPAGEYEVRVVHEFPGQGRGSEHMETEEVEVPPAPIAT